MAASPRQRAAGHLALIFAMVTFSLWNVLAESIGGTAATPLLVCAMRDVTSLLCLSLVSVLREQCKGGPRARAGLLAEVSTSSAELETCGEREQGSSSRRCTGASRDWLLTAGVGLCGPFGAALGSLLCSTWASADTTGILNALTPACTGLFATLLGIDEPSWSLAVAIVLGSASGLVAVDSPTSSAGPGRPAGEFTLGVFAGLAAILGQAFYFIFTRLAQLPRPGRPPRDPLALITQSYLFAASGSVVLCAAVAPAANLGFRSMGSRGVLLALYAGVVCGALNFALITWACRYVRVSVCSLYGALQPPCTALIAFLLRGEALQAAGLLSGALAIASLLCAVAGPLVVAAVRGAAPREACPAAIEDTVCSGPSQSSQPSSDFAGAA